MGYPAYYTSYGGSPPTRTGLSHATIAPYGPYRTGDNRKVMLGIQNEREWHAFCDLVLHQPELINDPKYKNNSLRVAHREEMDELIDSVFHELTAQAIIERLARANIANARINSVQEFWDHEQLRARDRWRTIGSPVGPIEALLPPVIMRDADLQMEKVPAPGEDNHEILQEIGYDDAEIDRLKTEAAI